MRCALIVAGLLSVFAGAGLAYAEAPESAPSSQMAEPAPAKRVYWNAVAGGIWNSADGAVQVAIGYSGARNSSSEAKASALRACKQSGRNCEAGEAFNFGCLYITTGRKKGAAGWVSRATSADTTKRCNEVYASCKTPIGGCVE
ncbi:MAG: hypothetical protein JWL87_279 [Candidatus Adlerbacteria bacterium]|nr:hypothetical protein [Candidatus Adlerbacteria bacterium]